jgi:hypothetical protein
MFGSGRPNIKKMAFKEKTIRENQKKSFAIYAIEADIFDKIL